MMRKLLFISVSLFTFVAAGQVNSNTINTNTNEAPVTEESIQVSDTVYSAPASIESEGNKREYTKPETSKKKSIQYKTADKDVSGGLSESSQAVGTAEATKVSANFSYTVQQSNMQRTQRTPTTTQQRSMNEAVDYFESSAPNSFECHYFKYVAGNYDVSLIDHLKEAEKLKPSNSDVHVQMAAYHMIKNNASETKIYLEKLKSSKRLTEIAISYAKDILISVPDSGVLITHGFDDTYGVWYDQQVNGIRKDVRIISLDFLQSEYYRNSLKKDGFKLPVSTVVNVSYLKEFCSLNASKKLAISLTTPKEYFVQIKDKLFVTGLVFQYHNGTFNNFEQNEQLWNSKLIKYLVYNSTDEKAKQLSANYLPMLFQLRSVYEDKGQKDKLAAIDKAIDKIAVQCKKYDQVQQLKKTY